MGRLMAGVCVAIWSRSLSILSLVTLTGGLLLASASVQASEGQTGRETGLRVPRYVSLKSDRVNLRQGPAKEHKTLWVYQRAGLPVEITAEFEMWRRIRDADGDEGWVLHSLLSGRRTAIIAPWAKDAMIELRGSPSENATITARIEPRVVATLRRCDQKWCRISGKGFDGFIPQNKLWGVYPDESLN